jgi:glycosyltransferase involved in cell wall biosynthesis
MKSKIALGMIVKDDTEVDSLKRCLDSVAPYVDGIYLTATQKPHKKLQKLAQQFGANIDIRPGEFNYYVKKEETDWLKKYFNEIYPDWGEINLKEGDMLFQFGKARNANIEFIPDEYQWLFWIDVDDVLMNGPGLRQSADNAMAQGFEAVFMNYLYQVDFDEQGKIKDIIIQHLRERLVRIDGDYRKVFKWIGNIHETLIQQRETKKVEDSNVEVLHISTGERMLKALDRNMRVLEHDIYTTKGKDPRPLYYYAKALYDLHTNEAHEKSKKLMLMYLSPEGHQKNMSGWKEERSQAWEYLGEIYRGQNQVNNSIKALHNSLIEYPQFPSTYFSLAVSFMMKEDYDNARFWAILGSKVPQAKTTLVSNPRDLESRKYEIIYNAGIKTNRIDEAWAACQKLKELFPKSEKIEQQWQFINETREIRDQLKSYAGLVNYLSRTGQQAKIKSLLLAAPSQLESNPYLEKLRQELMPPKDWKENSIAFYCGPQFTPWDATSIKGKGNSFVGGSEEAVIYLTKELAKLGWKVVVYADPVKEGIYDGVEYLMHYKFNVRDNFNILVYWRAVAWIDMNCKAKKTYLWCHDVQNDAEYSKDRIEKLTKVIVLSEAHRKNIPSVSDDKVLISSNGYYEHHPKTKPKNNPKWCLYTSSYDRGLENLLNVWGDVKKEVKDAELHIFYGWKLFENFYRGNPERMAWMKKMNQLMEQPGITHHDRVSQPEMEKWHKKCGIWAYPSHFYEINCISAIKSQLWGCVPVTTNFAALKETVKYGKKVDGEIYENFSLSPKLSEDYKKELIKALKDENWQSKQRDAMMKWAREKYSWKEIARQWNTEFKDLN